MCGARRRRCPVRRPRSASCGSGSGGPPPRGSSRPPPRPACQVRPWDALLPPPPSTVAGISRGRQCDATRCGWRLTWAASCGHPGQNVRPPCTQQCQVTLGGRQCSHALAVRAVTRHRPTGTISAAGGTAIWMVRLWDTGVGPHRGRGQIRSRLVPGQLMVKIAARLAAWHVQAGDRPAPGWPPVLRPGNPACPREAPGRFAPVPRCSRP